MILKKEPRHTQKTSSETYENPTQYTGRVPEPTGGCQEADSHLKAAYAAQNECDAHIDQVARAANGKPYRDITNFVDNKPEPTPAEYWRGEASPTQGRK